MDKLKNKLIPILLFFAIAITLCGSSAAATTTHTNNTNLTNSTVHAGDPIINGTVYIDDYGTRTLANATITVNSTTGKTLATTTTNQNGYYSVDFYSTNTSFYVTATYPGCTGLTQTVTVSNSTNTPGDPNYYGTGNFTLNALTATYTSNNVGSSIYLPFYSRYNYAGSLNMNINGTTYSAYCIDLYTEISTGDSLWVNGPLPGTQGNLSSQVDWAKVTYILMHYSPTNTTEGAAIQCAIWYFTSAPYGVYNGSTTSRYQFMTDNVTTLYDGYSTTYGSYIYDRAWQIINAAQDMSYPKNIVVNPGITSAPNGQPENITATVYDQNGNPLSGVTVNFSTSSGSLNITQGTTDSNGQVTVTLTPPGNNTSISVTGYVSGNYGNLLYDNPAQPLQNLAALTLLPYALAGTSIINYGTTANVALSQTVNGASSATVNVGDPLTYIITATNTGSNNATGLMINDIIPTGLTNVTVTPSIGTFYNNVWTIPNLSGLVSATLTIVAKAGAAMAGLTTNNTATRTYQNEYDTLLNTTTVSVYTKKAQLNITNTPNQSTLNVDNTGTFTLTVTNSGPDPASNIQITDPAPNGFTVGSPSIGTYNNGVWTITSLASGSSGTLTFTGIITANQAGTNITNTATETQTEYPPTTIPNATIHVNEANVALTSTSTTPVNVGGTVTYIVTATNNGPDTGSNIKIADTAPSGLSNVTITPSSGTSYNGGVWSISSLNNGATATLNITGTSTSSMAGLNTTNAATRTSQTEYNNQNTTTTSTVYTQESKVNLNITSSVPSVIPGSSVTFTITATNNGPDTATNILIAVTEPSLSGITRTASTGTTYSATTHIWTIPSLASGASDTLTIKGNAQTANNNTWITCNITETNQTQYNPTSPNTAVWKVFVGDNANVAITNTANQSNLNVGQTGTFTLFVKNNGPYAATNIIITDPIPSGFTVGTIPTGTTYNSTTGVWTITKLLNGANATLVFSGVLTSGQAGTTITNMATETQTQYPTSETILNATIHVNTISTTLTVGSVSGYKGSTVNLNATLSNIGQPVSGETIQFYVNGVSVGSGTTNSSGIATYQYLITQTSGTYLVNATFAGDTTYAACNGSNNLTVGLLPTSVAVSPVTGAKGDKVNLTATLLDTHNSVPVANETVNFTVNGVIVGSGTTNSSGIATYQYLITQTSGTYLVNATFAGDTTYATGNGSNNLTVGLLPTSVAVSPVSGAKGDKVNLTATLLDTHNGVPVNGETIQFYVNGVSVGSGTTNSSGVATYQYTITQTSGTYLVNATFAGDTTYATSTGTNNLTVGLLPTSVAVNPVTGGKGDKVTLTATLTDTHNSVPVANELVNFTVNGVSVGSGTTNSSGIATYQYLITQTSGTYLVNATFAGDSTYAASMGSNNLTVGLLPTSVAVSPVSGANGDKVNLTATLTDTHNSVPVANELVNFTVNGVSVGSGTTNSSGIATYQYLITQTSGTYLVNATFAGDSTYAASMGSNNLTVGLLPTSVAVSPVSGANGDKVTLTATLTDTHNSVPVANELVNFTVNGVSVGSGTTNSSGIATYQYLITQTSGTYLVNATFAGDSTYAASMGSNNLTVGLLPTSVVVNPASGGKGDKVTLTATLTDTHNSVPVANELVNFTVNGVSVGSGTTNSSGIATYQYLITQTSGTYLVNATFAGDSTYAASMGSNNLTVGLLPTSVVVNPASGGKGDKVTLTATLTDTHNSVPVANELVNFTVNGVSVGSGTTNSSGIATYQYLITQTSGTYLVNATFAGDSTYAAGNGINNLTVNKQANVILTNTPSNLNPNVGQQYYYTISLTNNGSDSASNVNVSDLLPTGLTFNSYTSTAGTTYNSTTGAWTVGSLANGATDTLTIYVTPNSTIAGTNPINNATETQTEYPFTVTVTSTVHIPDPDVVITNVGNPSSANVSDTINFTLNATNNGPDSATGINVTDQIPYGFNYTGYSSSIPGSYNPTTGIWTVGTLTNGTTAWLTLTGTAATSSAGDNITNHATESNNEWPGYANIPDANIYVKEANVQLSQVGGYSSNSVTFNVTATNSGPDNASNVVITDAIPSGLSNPSVSISAGSYTILGGVITWTIPSLTNGANATLTLTGTSVPQSTTRNTATLSGQNEYNPFIPFASSKSVYTPLVDVSVYQYPWYYNADTGTYQDFYYTANTPVFTVDVYNGAGYDDATDVTITYVIGNGLIYDGYDTQGIGTVTFDKSTNTLTWVIPFMPANGEVFMKVMTSNMLSGDYSPSLTNTATITHVDQTNLSPTTTASYSLITPTSVDVSVNQTQSTTEPVQIGNTVTYTLTVTNHGPDDATSVQITDELPTGLQYVSDTSGGSYNPTTGVWNIGNLNNGQTVTLTITAKITATSGTIKNTATLTNTDQYDWNWNDQSQTSDLTVTGSYTPTVDVSVYQYPWYYNADTGTYQDFYYTANTPVFTVDVYNGAGYDDATDVTITYVIGNGLIYDGYDTQGIGTVTFDKSTNTLTWVIPFMPANGEVFMKVMTSNMLSGDYSPSLTNTATITHVDQTNLSPTTTASYSLITPTSVDVSVNQTQSTTEPVQIGNTVTYTLTVTNHGPDDATSVQITDELPTGLQYVSDTSGGSYNPTTGVWNIGNLNNGQTVTLTITAKITATSGTIKNTATLTNTDQYDWNWNDQSQILALV